ncbi:maltose O-acetyltransferase [Lactobacillus selangorensis]|uniref:Maltose O-acetyltransferase n=1 Tax=Lactobacillus selangorensis TaxID=81857 RepID=A0A0R2FSC2_9LACO|nr:DapH/DapD/GlmU-related protein [Lactobacillus selangorensis]KRN28133.1 maltose O-acetyltransferase [Lactobacillus selangorensis]KRN30990.1 maltose O-acetyltransferase [Lactobacillus selangorensis]
MAAIQSNTEHQRKIIAQNQRLIQHLNTDLHSPEEINQLVSEVVGYRIDASTEIRLPFYTDYGRNIKLGKHIFINSNVMMVDLGGITIDDEALIGPGAYLVSVNHQNEPAQRHNLDVRPVHIKRNAWIGARAIILPGVTVGENAIVGAGAIVTKNVAANTVVVGSPAHFLRHV